MISLHTTSNLVIFQAKLVTEWDWIKSFLCLISDPAFSADISPVLITLHLNDLIMWLGLGTVVVLHVADVATV